MFYIIILLSSSSSSSWACTGNKQWLKRLKPQTRLLCMYVTAYKSMECVALGNFIFFPLLLLLVCWYDQMMWFDYNKEIEYEEGSLIEKKCFITFMDIYVFLNHIKEDNRFVLVGSRFLVSWCCCCYSDDAKLFSKKPWLLESFHEHSLNISRDSKNFLDHSNYNKTTCDFSGKIFTL